MLPTDWLERKLSSARLVALEEAARVCDERASLPGADGQDTQLADHELRLCAQAIRLLSGEGK